MMTSDDSGIETVFETGLAIDRALEAANLRAGDSLGSTTAFVSEEWGPTAAEAGDGASGIDGD
jgi:hypothetical protein